MSDKKFTIEDLSNLLLSFMNKNIKENEKIKEKNIESGKEEPKNIIEDEEISLEKKNNIKKKY